VPDFAKNYPNLIPWVFAARSVMVLVFALSFILIYKALDNMQKNEAGEE